MRKIILYTIFLFLIINVVSASHGSYTYYSFNGDGEPHYPNSGYIYISGWCSSDDSEYTQRYSDYYFSYGHTIYYKIVGYGSMYDTSSPYGSSYKLYFTNYGDTTTILFEDHSDSGTINLHTSNTFKTSKSNNRRLFLDVATKWGTSSKVYGIMYISPYNNMTYNISGTYLCVNNVSLYGYINSTYKKIDYTNNTSYSFTIFDGIQYKLVFSDGHEYEFTCNGSDVEYDYDACNYGIINLYDNCANLLINPFIVVYNLDNNMNIIYAGHNNPVTFLSSDINDGDELDVIWTTWQGTFQKRCFAQFDHPINLFDQSIYWNLGIHVWDENVNRCSDALTIFDQDCIINGYPKRNGFTDSLGYIGFTQCENDNGNLTVDKSGYKSLNVEVVNTFDTQTKNYGVNVFLEPDNSSNETDWSMVNDSWNDTNMTEMPEEMPGGIEYTMLLYFRDPDGHKTNCVLNNTSYVRCFYGIKYPAPVNMKLDFERSMNGLGYTTLCSYPYSIDNNSCGYWEINNSYFNDPDYIYKAHIYDQTDEHIGRYAYLRVVAAPEEQNYTAFAIFSPDEPLIDYREYIKGKVFANATSGSLPDLSLELYDEDTLIEYFNYTQSDFDSYGWAYWLLGYNYTLHRNYTLLLKNDAGDIVSSAYTYAEDMRGNKLTVKVIDPSGNPLDHSYIFLKNYGRIPTNNQCYGTFEGLANQDYYYKAEKGGYRSTGWDMVSPVDEDTLVTYTLIPESPVYQNRMTKADVKNLYYPFMYILLIIMLVGGLVHVFN